MTGNTEEPQGQSAESTSADPHRDDMADALGAEAARLAQAFSAWVDERAPAQSDTSDEGQRGESDTPSQFATTASPVCGCGSQKGVDVVCRMCPICRAAEFLHTVRPEVLERCADVLAMIANSLQAIAADRPAQEGPPPGPGSPPGDGASSSSTNGTQGTKGTESGEASEAKRPRAESEKGISIPVHGEDEFTTDVPDERQE